MAVVYGIVSVVAGMVVLFAIAWLVSSGRDREEARMLSALAQLRGLTFHDGRGTRVLTGSPNGRAVRLDVPRFRGPGRGVRWEVALRSPTPPGLTVSYASVPEAPSHGRVRVRSGDASFDDRVIVEARHGEDDVARAWLTPERRSALCELDALNATLGHGAVLASTAEIESDPDGWVDRLTRLESIADRLDPS